MPFWTFQSGIIVLSKITHTARSYFGMGAFFVPARGQRERWCEYAYETAERPVSPDPCFPHLVDPGLVDPALEKPALEGPALENMGLY